MTWTACANTDLANHYLLSIVIDAKGLLYAGTEDGLFVSDDGCATWAASSGGLPLP